MTTRTWTPAPHLAAELAACIALQLGLGRLLSAAVTRAEQREEREVGRGATPVRRRTAATLVRRTRARHRPPRALVR